MVSFRSFIGSELMSIKQNIAAVRNMIPNSVKLKPSERRSMFKLNTKRQEFVQKAIQNMRKSPNTVPSFVDVTVCNNYVHLYGQYTELLDELEQVKNKLEDAKLVIGNEIMNQKTPLNLEMSNCVRFTKSSNPIMQWDGIVKKRKRHKNCRIVNCKRQSIKSFP